MYRWYYVFCRFSSSEDVSLWTPWYESATSVDRDVAGIVLWGRESDNDALLGGNIEDDGGGVIHLEKKSEDDVEVLGAGIGEARSAARLGP